MSKKNRKIQLRLYPSAWSDSYWELQYRIQPSELSWFGRIFNFWRDIYIFDECGLGKWKTIEECWRVCSISSKSDSHGIDIFEGFKKQLVDEKSLENFFNEQTKNQEYAINNSDYVNGRIIY